MRQILARKVADWHMEFSASSVNSMFCCRKCINMDVWDFALATLHGLDFVGQFAQWILATRRSPAMYALDSCILDSHCQSYFHVETFEHMFVTAPDDAEPMLKSFSGKKIEAARSQRLGRASLLPTGLWKSQGLGQNAPGGPHA